MAVRTGLNEGPRGGTPEPEADAEVEGLEEPEVVAPVEEAAAATFFFLLPDTREAMFWTKSKERRSLGSTMCVSGVQILRQFWQVCFETAMARRI
jgi:hypothetical protein